MSKPIRVIQYGLGAIGRASVRLALSRPGVQVVGAVDRDPQLTGKDLGEVLGLGRKLDILVTDKPVMLFAQTHADVVIHCTTSSFVEAYEQLTEIVRAGLHCVTSCEEAMFPYYRHKLLAGKLDDLCIQKSAAVVGTGVNPGLVMDTLALLLTMACQRIEAIRVLRVVDAGNAARSVATQSRRVHDRSGIQYARTSNGKSAMSAWRSRWFSCGRTGLEAGRGKGKRGARDRQEIDQDGISHRPGRRSRGRASICARHTRRQGSAYSGTADVCGRAESARCDRDRRRTAAAAGDRRRRARRRGARRRFWSTHCRASSSARPACTRCARSDYRGQQHDRISTANGHESTRIAGCRALRIGVHLR